MKNQHIDLWDKAESRNHSYWTFYAFFVVAIAGWLFMQGNDIKWAEQTILTAGFFVFSCFNLSLIARTSRLLEVIATEIEKNTTNKDNDPLSKSVVNCIGKCRLKGSVILPIIIDLCVVVAIWT